MRFVLACESMKKAYQIGTSIEEGFD